MKLSKFQLRSLEPDWPASSRSLYLLIKFLMFSSQSVGFEGQIKDNVNGLLKELAKTVLLATKDTSKINVESALKLVSSLLLLTSNNPL